MRGLADEEVEAGKGEAGKGEVGKKRTKRDGEVEMAKERTFLMIKPEAVENGHVGEICLLYTSPSPRDRG